MLGVKYTPSALVSEFSGTAGSTVASHNRYGPYMRTRTIPVNPNTTSQVAARNSFAASSRAWRGLSSGQRAAWAAAAVSVTLFDRLGRAYNPTSFQLFMSVNRTTYVYSGATTTTTAPPTSSVPLAIATATPNADSGTSAHTITYSATPLAAATKLIIEATPQLSNGVTFVKPSLYRQILVTAAAAASPSNVAASYVAKFGALISGKKIAYRLTPITSDGQRGAPFYVTGSVV